VELLQLPSDDGRIDPVPSSALSPSIVTDP